MGRTKVEDKKQRVEIYIKESEIKKVGKSTNLKTAKKKVAKKLNEQFENMLYEQAE